MGFIIRHHRYGFYLIAGLFYRRLRQAGSSTFLSSRLTFAATFVPAATPPMIKIFSVLSPSHPIQPFLQLQPCPPPQEWRSSASPCPCPLQVTPSDQVSVPFKYASAAASAAPETPART